MKKYQLGEFEEIVILTIGILNNRAYSVSIKDEIESRLSRSVSFGALHTALKRLEEKGYLKSFSGESTEERAGRPRQYFEITAIGKKAMKGLKAGGTRIGAFTALVIVDYAKRAGLNPQQDLQIVGPHIKGRAIEPQPAPEPLRFEARFEIVDGLFAEDPLRDAGLIETTGTKAGAVRRIQPQVRAWNI